MIITLEEVKQHLRNDDSPDPEDVKKEDSYITILINAAEQFVRDGTGKVFTNTNWLAKAVCLLLVADMYENREMTTAKVGQRTSKIAEMLLTQLSFSSESGGSP